MLFIKEMIGEAENVKSIFEESRDLISYMDGHTELERKLRDRVVDKYQHCVNAISELISFLRRVKTCNTDKDISHLLKE